MPGTNAADLVIRSRSTLIAGSPRPGWIALSGGIITKIGTGAAPAAARVVDAGGDCIGPAFVDTHIHGFGGFDASDCGDSDHGEEILHSMARALLASGVGAFCPTLYPLAPARTLECLQTIRKLMKRAPPDEAVVVGAHLEGPFVSPARPGALDVARLRAPDAKLMQQFIDTGAVSIITIAPELPGALEIVKQCAAANILVSMGHSAATFAECKHAARRGAGAITHIFNAMAPVHHRDASIANFALVEDAVSAELIPDLKHVSAPAIDLLLRSRGLNGIRLVSDNLAAAGTGARKFQSGGAKLTVKDGIAYRAEGMIAGSCLPLGVSVGALARTGLLTIGECWRLASDEPAMVIKPRAVHGFARLSS
ncbi:MAG: amidohydrolase family protein [Planctomycetes bacterium]|nr:amidohydrolase family protein [Planctomycetota bacterium]